MYEKHIRAIVHYLMRVVPKGPDEEAELAALIEYLSRRMRKHD